MCPYSTHWLQPVLNPTLVKLRILMLCHSPLALLSSRHRIFLSLRTPNPLQLLHQSLPHRRRNRHLVLWDIDFVPIGQSALVQGRILLLPLSQTPTHARLLKSRREQCPNHVSHHRRRGANSIEQGHQVERDRAASVELGIVLKRDAQVAEVRHFVGGGEAEGREHGKAWIFKEDAVDASDFDVNVQSSH
ncbi:uncharacterized protein K441DRAFT_359421 [Cenococcum geophilum 1.58]|uniref:Uncharacterized protein n=1 Tax=Cenococcum geophilum 1.58 TaxID=794803 RepID=A0ACC8EME9_9PEZI|nr:hypothetical protein K441DRAFT_359421 [Cenococcum geophilum 1.58]